MCLNVRENNPPDFNMLALNLLVLPGGFGKLREACRKNAPPIFTRIHASGDLLMTPNTKKRGHDYQHHDYSSLSVQEPKEKYARTSGKPKKVCSGPMASQSN